MSDHDPNRDKGKKRAEPQNAAESERARRQRLNPGVEWCTNGWCTGAPGPGPTTGFAHTNHNHPFIQNGGIATHNHRKEQLDMRRAELQQRQVQHDRNWNAFNNAFMNFGDQRENRRRQLRNDHVPYSDAYYSALRSDPYHSRYDAATYRAAQMRRGAHDAVMLTRRERQTTVDDPKYVDEYMAGKYDDDYVMSEAKRQNQYQDDGGGGGY